MPKKKRQERDDSFLPGPGQAADDPGADFLVQCFVVLLRAGWGMVKCVLVPVWALVRFLAWEAWQQKRS